MYVIGQYQVTGSTTEAIAASIERGIAESVLAPDARLPPIRELAGALGVSPGTVAAAYRRLRERGLVVGGGRRGTHVTPRPPLSRPGLLPLRDGVRDLRFGVPDPALLPDLTSTLPSRRANHRLGGRSGSNEPELLQAAAEQFAADGIDPSHLAVVGGALDGVERLLATHVTRGDLVAIEDPTYPPIFDLLAALGATPVPVAVDDEGIRADALRDALSRRPAALVIVPRAQNPTGAVITPERAEALRALLRRADGTLVVEDDYAYDIVGAPLHTLTAETERWASVRSVSKSLNPDLRLAVVAADPVTISRLEGRQALGTGWVSTILQRAVIDLWDDPATAGIVSRAREVYDARRQALREALEAHGIPSHGSSGLNVWVPLRDEAATVGSLMDAGWAVLAGEQFRIRSGPGMRVTTASLLPKEASELAAAIARSMQAMPGPHRMY